MGFTNYITQIKDTQSTPVTYDLVDTSASHYVKGTQTAATNAWTGALPDGVTAYYDGLSIDYFLPYAGTSSAATLNLGGLGAKPVYLGNTASNGVTTHYLANTVIHLTYVIASNLNSGNGCWKATAFYNTNDDYRVRMAARGTTKAYLLGTSTEPASSNQNVTSLAETGVYFDTTAGTLVATTFKGALTGTASGNLTSSSTLNAAKLSGAIPDGVTATTQTAGDSSTKLATTAFVNDAVKNLAGPMRFIGSLGTGGTATSLAAAADGNKGYAYKVITAGTYQSVAAKVGDLLVSNGSSWVLIPSGDEPNGTVTSITLKAGNGISLDTDNTAITTSGTRTISHADTSSQSSITASNRTYIKSVTLDTYGHVTGLTTGTETVTDTNTTYTIATGDSNGQIKVTPSSGSAYNVSVKGLGSNAYTSTNYLPLTGGTVTGPVIFGDSITVDEATVGDLLVNGSANFTNGLKSSTINGGNATYFVKGTQTASTNVWTGNLPAEVTAYYDGLTIDYFLPYAGTGTAATLNLSGLGAKPIYVGNTATSGVTTHYPANTVIHLTYVVASNLNSGNGCWKATAYQNSTYWYTTVYCTTGASTAAKTGACSFYKLATGYFPLTIQNANTSASALTLNINSKGAKPIYINGTASSSTNYTLPEGQYIAYYDGTNYHIRTDGKLPGNIAGSAGSVAWSGVSSKPNLVNTITTTAGAHTAISNATGAVSFNVPTKTSHLTNDSSFVTSSGVTSISASTGLKTDQTSNAAITGTGTIKANLRSETKLTNASAAGTETSGRIYPVALDKDGYLAVNVPWTNVNSSYTGNTGTVTKVIAGTGLAIGTTAQGNFTTSGTINHTNSVTAQTTQAIYPIKIDSEGHISAYGSAVTPLTASSTLDATKLSGTIPTSCYTNTWTAMVGATSSANGTAGYIGTNPPKDGYNTKYWRADGSWTVPPNNAVTQSASTTASWRKVLLHYKDDAASTTSVTSSTNQVYASVGISVQPSTNTLRAANFSVADGGTITYNSTTGCIEIICA